MTDILGVCRFTFSFLLQHLGFTEIQLVLNTVQKVVDMYMLGCLISLRLWVHFAGQGLEFTEASEFARSIQLREPDDAAARPADSAGHMGVDDAAAASAAASTLEPAAAAAPPPPKRNVRSK